MTEVYGLQEKERGPFAQEQAKEGNSCNRAEPTTAVDQATENKDRQHRALRAQSATHQSPLASSPPLPSRYPRYRLSDDDSDRRRDRRAR